MVEGTGLENRRTGNGTVSSNLTLSVQYSRVALLQPRVWAARRSFRARHVKNATLGTGGRVV